MPTHIDVKIIVAAIGLLGTVISLLVAYRQWRLTERFKREVHFTEQRQARYHELWDKMEKAHLSLRGSQSADVGEPEGIQFLRREKQFDSAVIDVNSFLLMNALYIDRRDRDASRLYMNTVQAYTSVLFRYGGPDALRAHGNTEESFSLGPSALSELEVKSREMERARDALIKRFRRTIRGL